MYAFTPAIPACVRLAALLLALTLCLPVTVMAGQTITITSGTLTQVAGNGVAPSGDISNANALLPAHDNSVIINGSAVATDVFGGYSMPHTGSASATGNSVIMNNSAKANYVFGGFSIPHTGSASATGNSVTINDSAVASEVFGGFSTINTGSASATGNSVIMNNSAKANYVFGGFSIPHTGSASATGNSVTINDSAVASEVFGGFSTINTGSASATGNSVIINTGTVGYVVHGGYSNVLSGSASATGNSVIINAGTVTGGVYGGASVDAVLGGSSYAQSGSASATGNSVIINGGTVAREVYGGRSHSWDDSASATGNSVTINGGTVTRDVYGGFSMTSTGSASATGNSVTISNSPHLTTSNLYGGGSNIPGSDVFSNNSLNVWGYTGGAIASAHNFQYYNFILPATMGHGSTALNVTGTVLLGNSGGTQDSTVSLNMLGGGTPMQAGDTVTLINAATLSGNAVNQNRLVQGRKGVSLLYDFQLAKTATTLTATAVGTPRLNPQTKALVEGRAAGMAFTLQGADLVAGAGLNAARGAAGTGQKAGGLAAFSAFQGGSSRYDTGSHVDVDGFSFMTGLGWNTHTTYGDLLLGAFFEYGSGTYDTYNSFNSFATVKGSGDTRYTGGGLLGRLDIPLADKSASTVLSTAYVEASVRAGWAETDFASTDLRDVMGQRAEYESGAMYYGAHVGLGTVWNLTEALNLDLHTKYFWTRQESDSVSVVGDPVDFKTADSHRWRGGARLGYTLLTEESGAQFTPYLGAAYEHEFDGKAKATSYGYSLDAPDLKGGTGIGELGITIMPGGDHGVSFDLGVQSYTGLREGVTGSFRMMWEF